MLMFRELVTRSSPYAFSLAFRILNDEELSKDAVQESMIKVWKKLGSFDSRNNYKTWLYRIVVHTCLDYLRKNKRNPEMKTGDRGWELIKNRMGSDMTADMENTEMALVIQSLTEKLSPAQKAVFVMSDLMGLDHDEISYILGMGKNSIKSNLFHARKSIGKMIKKYIQ